ncbi:MAG: non-ribosomal peptide synthetase [Clostridiaceae bacterium]
MKGTDKTFERKASPNELLYTSFQDIYTTFSIQFVVEGSGDICKREFENAVKKAAEACPGARCVLKGKQWIDSGRNPKIYYMEHIDFDGYDFSRERMFNKKIDVEKNPPVEIFVVGSKQYRIFFRIFHGAMDGKGALIFVENIFKAFRGEKLIYATAKENDLSFLSLIESGKFDNKLKHDIQVSKEKINTSQWDIYWKRLSVRGVHPGIVAKIAKTITEIMPSDKNKFLIPVDIRRHKLDIKSTANLTLPIFLETNKNDKWEDINSRLLYGLKNNQELNIKNADLRLLANLPKTILRKAIKLTTWYQGFKGKYMVGGIISHLGKVDLRKFTTGNFVAEAFYSIPIQQPLAPLAMVIAENKKYTEIVVSSYKNIISEEKMQEILKKIEDTLTGAEIYSRINETKVNYEDGKTVIDLFCKQVEDNPNNIAVVYREEKLTYNELNKKSDILASFLVQKGISNSSYVGVYLNRSINFIISILAIIKTGATFIPIDTSYPIDKVKSILGNDEIEVITESAHEANLRKVIDKELIYINYIDFSKDIEFKIHNKDEKNIIYQIYTSGSTSIPKGVQIEDKSLKNYLYWAKRIYNTDSNTRFPLFTSISVDLTITSIFLPLISGGTIEVYEDDLNHIVLKQILENTKVNCVKLTPTHLRLINGLKIEPKNKKKLIVGGEQLDTKLALLAQNIFGDDCKIINEYGPTEATIGCIYHVFNKEKDSKENYVPIGTPIDNTKIVLLNEEKVMVRPGETGEIYISGDCLAKGYYKNHNFNEQKFLNINDERFYRTGDLAKLNGKNQFIYLGRIDNQIKINGNRVEIGEIEAVISGFDNIQDAVVIFCKETKILKAFYTTSGEIDITKLREYLKVKLPIYMMPKSLVEIEKIPIARSGKIDKKKMLEIKDSNIEHKYLDKMELSEEEKKLMIIWSKILKVDVISLDDNFYDLGGDSLSFITMIENVSNKIIGTLNEKEFLESVKAIYDQLTVRELIKVVESLRRK